MDTNVKANQRNENIFIEEVIEVARRISQTHFSIKTCNYHQLPTFTSYHFRLLEQSRNHKSLPLLNRVANFSSNLSKRQILKILQYHPNYPKIMEEFAYLERHGGFIKAMGPRSVLQGPFIPLKIRETIFKKYSHCYQLQLELIPSHNIRVPVNLTIVERSPINSKTLHGFCQAIVTVLATVFNAYEIKEPNPVNIYLYPTRYRKQIPEDNHLSSEVLTFLKNEANKYTDKELSIDNYALTTGVNEVNSAMCTLNRLKPKDSNIVIFRHEEWINRLCHELVHYFKLEKLVLPSLTGPGINRHLRVNPNELITECQTYFLWAVYRLYRTHERLLTNLGRFKRPENDPTIKFYLQRMLRKDQTYLIKIGHQFLAHYGTSLGELYWAEKPIININSNAFYYYILRGIIWTKFDNTLLALILPGKSLSLSQLLKNLNKKIVESFKTDNIVPHINGCSLKFYV